MTLTKKNTRRITIAGEEYLWHLNRRFENRSSWIVIQHSCYSDQLLCLNPYSHDLLIGPGAVAEAIRFALNNGWTPQTKAAPMYLDYERENFIIVKGDPAKYRKKPPDIIWFTGPSTHNSE